MATLFESLSIALMIVRIVVDNILRLFMSIEESTLLLELPGSIRRKLSSVTLSAIYVITYLSLSHKLLSPEYDAIALIVNNSNIKRLIVLMIGVFPNLKQSYHFTFFRLAGNMINLGMDICFCREPFLYPQWSSLKYKFRFFVLG